MSGAARRRIDPEGTRQAILDAAHAEFVQNGLSGARVDAIAARTDTVKRMIYYYYGSKEGLYLAVLERAYAGIRETEAGLALDLLPPPDAIRRMVETTFDYHETHPDFSRLVSVENIHHGRFIAQSEKIRAINSTVLDLLGGILRRGVDARLFRADVEPVDVHMVISALCFFRVSNRHTFGQLFQHDLADPETRSRQRQLVVEAVLRVLAFQVGEPTPG